MQNAGQGTVTDHGRKSRRHEISCAYDTASQNGNSQHQRKKVCSVLLGVYPLVVMNEESLWELRAAEKVNLELCETLPYYWGNAFMGLIIWFKI